MNVKTTRAIYPNATAPMNHVQERDFAVSASPIIASQGSYLHVFLQIKSKKPMTDRLAGLSRWSNDDSILYFLKMEVIVR